MSRLRLIFHFWKAVLASFVFGFPGKKIKLIGVTGTDGKTTTCYMIYHILKNNGFNVGIVSTVGLDVGEGLKMNEEHTTTPDVFVLQRLLSEAKNNGVEYMILEVSSHGLDQNRLWGCDFLVSVITNLSAEHLDYHKNMDNYFESKARLFDMSLGKVFNFDDNSYVRLGRRFPSHVKYSVNNKGADYSLENVKLRLKIPGEYNKSNALAAVSVCDYLGVSIFKCVRSLIDFDLPPGRMEVVQKKPFWVINDFAHTPNGLENLFFCLRSEDKRRKIIHAFGCAGERDTGKRRLMGEISAKYSRVIILTAEDPRRERVDDINREIVRGIPEGYCGKVFSIDDREEAIKKAISMAGNGWMVVCTGKGAEKTQEIGKLILPWDETRIIKKYLK